MNLYDKIMALYPNLTQKDFDNTIHLQNDSDGKGDYIAKWEHTLAKPTDDVLYENTNLTSLNRELA